MRCMIVCVLCLACLACGSSPYQPSVQDVVGTYDLSNLELGANRTGYGYGSGSFGPPDWFFTGIASVSSSVVTGKLVLYPSQTFEMSFTEHEGTYPALLTALADSTLAQLTMGLVRQGVSGTYDLNSSSRTSEVIIGVGDGTTTTSHYITFQPGTSNLIAEESNKDLTVFDGTLRVIHILGGSADEYDNPLAAFMTFRLR